MVNKTSKIAIKYFLFFLFFLIINSQLCYSQKKKQIISVEKLLIDAKDVAYKRVKPGDTLYFTAGKRKFLNIKNFKGEPGKPIVMTNMGGDVIIDTDHYYGISIENCRYIKFTGSGFPGQIYGFKIKRVANGAGISIGYLSSDFEIDHISVENTLIAGLYAKTDPDCSPASSRSKFTQFNTVIHDNYLAYTGNEGMYIGSTKYFGQTVKCNQKDTLLMPGILDGVKVYNNIVKYSGWDGIQVSSASKNCQIYDNTILFDSQKNEDSQMSGILIGGGTKCDCFNNYIAHGNGDGIECHGLGGNRIFNNIIVEAGQKFLPADKTKMKHGIFVSDVSVQKDSSFYIMHNNIIHPKSDGIRFLSVKSRANYISSNVIINPGNFDYYQNGKANTKAKEAYIMVQDEDIPVTLTNNYLARDLSHTGFSSQNIQSANDFMLTPGSPLIDVADTYPKAFVPFDFYYRQRPYGPKSDIGAFEYIGTDKSHQIK